MSKNKLKVLLVFMIGALISVLTQIPAASAQTANFLPIYPAASWTLGSNAPGSLHFGKVNNKYADGKTAPEACTASPSNQVSWYRGENNGNDSQGTNNGTLGGGTDFAPGKIGQGFRFDTPGEVLTVPQTASVNVAANGSLSMEAWIKPNTPRVTLAPEAMIFIWRNNFGDGVYFARDFEGRLAVEFQDLNRVRHYIQTDRDVLTASDFQHVAATYSSTTGIGTIYLNGSVVAAQNVGRFTPATNGDFRIGNNVFSDYLFDGIIDEPAIYNRALSQTEIQSIFDAGSAGKCGAAALQISPTTANVATGATQNFTASSGAASYAFSILTNNSGGSIESSTGIYTAGNSAGTTDTIRVTDALGATADASVTIASVCTANQKTWDGGGATNNWSDALNWTCDALPSASDTVIFDGTSAKDATVDINLNLNILNISAGYAGSISQGASNVTLSGAFSQAGGTFDGGSGATIFNGSFEQTGGTFNASVGTTTVVGGVFKREAGATFNHRNGTFVFAGNQVQVIIVSGATVTQDFGNLAINTPGGLFGSENDTLRVNGSLNLNNGAIFSIVVEALGAVNVANTFGNGTEDPGAGKILFSGSATRIVTLPVLSGAYNAIELNAPNTTINLSGAGEVKLAQLNLIGGTFNAGTTSVRFHRVGGFSSTQSGGVFDCGSGIITFNFGSFTQTGGSFNCQNGTIDSTTASGLQLNLNGGTFNAPSGTMTFRGGFFRRTANGTFNHDNGTVVFGGNGVQIDIVSGSAATQEFGNLTVNTAGGLFGADNDPLRINGNLSLSGQAFTVNFFALGNVTVPSGFSTNTSTHITFTGSSNQTFSNGGGANAAGNWTINKPGGTVTALTSLILDANQPLNITSGTLYLNENSNLTAGAITVGANGKLVNESATTITLGGNVSNSGMIDLQGGGAGCPENDAILIRSTSGTQRSWSGAGRFRLVDVDVQNMGGTGTKTVFSGTDSGGNNTSWIFNANCPTALSITPSSAGVQTGGNRTFAAGGGFAPYSFSILTNNSGGSINSANGVYTAGTTAGTTDTIRVTDAFGATADASVNVFGAPVKLAFSVQPTNAVAGQIIAPPIRVTVQDQFGNTVTNSTASITVSLQNNPSGGSLSGTLTRGAVNGIATFDNLSLNRTATSYTLRAVSGGLTAATSSTFDIAAGAPDHLSFVVQPSNASRNAFIFPPPQVEIQDALGNPVPSAVNAVTIAIGNNPANAMLAGTLTRNASNSAAIFDDLQIDTPQNGYTLIATSGVLTAATSAAFNIISPFVVTNTNDSGEGSLRQAILATNAATGLQTISFNIPGTAPFTITPTTPLPVITDPLEIDGRTQSGFSGTPVIEISGANLAAFRDVKGLHFAAGNSRVLGLSITRFESNLGLLDTGIVLAQNDCIIEGNYIGITPTGGLAGNGTGILILGLNNLVGGTSAAERNVISGSKGGGISIQGSDNQITGNYIGTDADGNTAQGNNVGLGISSNVHGAKITGNIISGNNSGGIFAGGRDNLIENNRIGLNANGAPIGNGASGAGIQFNNTADTRVRLTANRIFASGKLGIALFNATIPTLNDPQDVDTGANTRQNYPVLNSATSFAGNTTINGTLNSTPSQTFTLEFFSSPTCHASGNGEGETFLGSANVTTDAGGVTGFTTNLPVAVPIGRVITATATDANGNTSEFSKCSSPVAAAVFSVAGRITNGAGIPFSNVIVNLQGTALSTVTNSNGDYLFSNLPGGINLTIVPVKTNVSFSPVGRVLTNLSANLTEQNFTGTQVSTIKGKIDSVFANTVAPLAGATVTLTGLSSGTINQVRKTDVFGLYSFAGVPSGDYRVEASKAGYTFSPAILNVALGSVNVAANFSAQPPPLTGRLVATAGNSISVLNADGSGAVQIASEANFLGVGKPSLTRDGRRLAFVKSVCPGGGNLCALEQVRSGIVWANQDGSGAFLRIAPDLNSYVQPAFSPDGTKFAFVEKAGASPNLFAPQTIRVIGVTSNISLRIYQAPADTFISSISWSPDGTEVAFLQRAISGAPKILRIKTDGSRTGLTEVAAGSLTSPVWSPDGTKIAFLSRISSTQSRIFTVNPDGSGAAALVAAADYRDIAWSPDGFRLGFIRAGQYGVINADGTQPVILRDSPALNQIAWSETFSPPTPSGQNVNTTSGAVNVTFGSVTTAGETTIVPIPPSSAGDLPGGYVIGTQAFEITTTAGASSPFTVCFTVPAATTQTQFNQLRILHNENGTLVDRTILAPNTPAPDFATRRLCARTTSLSPFALAELIDPALPRISGLLRDPNGDPMSGIPVALTGTETRAAITDSDGGFSFVNLTDGGNYNVQPKQVGYLFTEYSQDIVNLAGEQAVFFEGTAANFQIGGRISGGNGNGISGVNVQIEGDTQDSVLTDANGDYVFTNLPADGFYLLTPFNGVNNFSPGSASVAALTSDAGGVNFQTFAPTAASVSIGGRVITPDGRGLRNARVVLTDSNGRVQTIATSTFGYYRFDGVEVGRTYVLNVESKKYRFQPQVLIVNEELTELNLTVED